MPVRKIVIKSIKKSDGTVVYQNSSSKKVESDDENDGFTYKSYLVYTDPTSDKWWAVEVSGTTVTTRWGKKGSDGTTKTIEKGDGDEAVSYAQKETQKKMKKGYNLVTKNAMIKTESPTTQSFDEMASLVHTFDRSPMLADKFFDPNLHADWLETGKKKKNAQSYMGGPGNFEDDAWTFSLENTLYTTSIEGWWISEKHDGVRAVWDGKTFVTRSGNEFVAPQWLLDFLPKDTFLDGEIHIGRGGFSLVSGITRHKTPNSADWLRLTFQVYDIPMPHLVTQPFEKRMEELKKVTDTLQTKWDGLKLADGLDKPKECIVQFTEQTLVKDWEHGYGIYRGLVESGAEGAMLRAPRSTYEYKRSKNLLKWKPILDAEAQVIGFNEGLNKNAGRLGTFRVILWDNKKNKAIQGKVFKLSGRLTDEIRSQYEFTGGKMVKGPDAGGDLPVKGDIVTFTYMELSEEGIPRMPIFQRVRRDL